MVNFDWQEHNCTTLDCGAHLSIESVRDENGHETPVFLAPVVDQYGEVADLKPVTNCTRCGARLDEQVRIGQ